MSIYAVGDIQGCLDPLETLLERVNFDPGNDLLISVGDLINRGPRSLDTLRFCKKLGGAFKMVLGNHDLHLLAVSEGVRKPSPKDTIQEILDAPDREEILSWLRSHPLLLTINNYCIAHAGIPHIWSIEQAQTLAEEVSSVIQSNKRSDYFKHMYGNQPDIWHESLTGPERWRVITNYLTRMRFCSPTGQLDLQNKEITSMPKPYFPWFSYTRSETKPIKIIFGHWAALKGKPCNGMLFALDTGYIWGGPLRMMKLETEEIFHQQAVN